MELLGATEPANLTNLRKLLTIIQGASVIDEQIKTLAAKKCKTLRRHKHLALWYAVSTLIRPPQYRYELRNASLGKPQERDRPRSARLSNT